jgi:hypothetical protein
MNQGVIMKKVIQIVSFLALVFVMAGVEAHAQSITKIDAVIPYDFQVGDEQFEAGRYVLRVKRLTNGAGNLVELRDGRHRVVWESFALENGETGSGKTNLVFDRSGSIAKLTAVRTGDRGYSISSDKTERGADIAAKKKKKGAETKN